MGELTTMTFKRYASGLILTGIFFSAHADSYPPSPACSKPYKPYKFNNRFEVDSYSDDVDRYKRCIQDFVRTQNEQAQIHLDAAKGAVEQWNSFVRLELN